MAGITRKFVDDPVIKVQAVICPFCAKPAGPNTNCENDKEPSMAKLGRISVPIFTATCYFKQKTPYICDINYPFSEDLCNKIMNIDGVISITPVHKYKFNIEVANAFDSKLVMQKVIAAFKTFIKELQSQELDLIEMEKNPITPVKFLLPNNVEVTIEPKDDTEMRILDQLKLDIPDIKQTPP